MRPAAAEWDEREETLADPPRSRQDRPLFPRLLRQPDVRPQRHRHPVVYEELYWGDPGIALALTGNHPRRRRRQRHSRSKSWNGPQMFGTPDDIKLGAFLRSRTRRGKRRRRHPHLRRLRRSQRRMGPQRHEDIDHQRRSHVHVVVASVDPELGTAAKPASSSRLALKASPKARSSANTASAPPTPPRSSSTTCASPAAACSVAKRN